MATWRAGNIPLPESHAVGLGAGLLVQIVAPRTLFGAEWIGHALGWPLIVGGLWLCAAAVWAAGSDLLARPNRLVVSGPYRRSRHPMYVGWTALYLGITFVVNTIWPLIALPLVLVWTHVEARREERRLDEHFGSDHRAYAARTRRYL